MFDVSQERGALSLLEWFVLCWEDERARLGGEREANHPPAGCYHSCPRRLMSLNLLLLASELQDPSLYIKRLLTEVLESVHEARMSSISLGIKNATKKETNDI